MTPTEQVLEELHLAGEHLATAMRISTDYRIRLDHLATVGDLLADVIRAAAAATERERLV